MCDDFWEEPAYEFVATPDPSEGPLDYFVKHPRVFVDEFASPTIAHSPRPRCAPTLRASDPRVLRPCGPPQLYASASCRLPDSLELWETTLACRPSVVSLGQAERWQADPESPSIPEPLLRPLIVEQLGDDVRNEALAVQGNCLAHVSVGGLQGTVSVAGPFGHHLAVTTLRSSHGVQHQVQLFPCMQCRIHQLAPGPQLPTPSSASAAPHAPSHAAAAQLLAVRHSRGISVLRVIVQPQQPASQQPAAASAPSASELQPRRLAVQPRVFVPAASSPLDVYWNPFIPSELWFVGNGLAVHSVDVSAAMVDGLRRDASTAEEAATAPAVQSKSQAANRTHQGLKTIQLVSSWCGGADETAEHWDAQLPCTLVCVTSASRVVLAHGSRLLTAQVRRGSMRPPAVWKPTRCGVEDDDAVMCMAAAAHACVPGPGAALPPERAAREVVSNAVVLATRSRVLLLDIRNPGQPLLVANIPPKLVNPRFMSMRWTWQGCGDRAGPGECYEMGATAGNGAKRVLEGGRAASDANGAVTAVVALTCRTSGLTAVRQLAVLLPSHHVHWPWPARSAATASADPTVQQPPLLAPVEHRQPLEVGARSWSAPDSSARWHLSCSLAAAWLGPFVPLGFPVEAHSDGTPASRACLARAEAGKGSCGVVAPSDVLFVMDHTAACIGSCVDWDAPASAVQDALAAQHNIGTCGPKQRTSGQPAAGERAEGHILSVAAPTSHPSHRHTEVQKAEGWLGQLEPPWQGKKRKWSAGLAASPSVLGSASAGQCAERTGTGLLDDGVRAAWARGHDGGCLEVMQQRCPQLQLFRAIATGSIMCEVCAWQEPVKCPAQDLPAPLQCHPPPGQVPAADRALEVRLRQNILRSAAAVASQPTDVYYGESDMQGAEMALDTGPGHQPWAKKPALGNPFLQRFSSSWGGALDVSHVSPSCLSAPPKAGLDPTEAGLVSRQSTAAVAVWPFDHACLSRCKAAPETSCFVRCAVDALLGRVQVPLTLAEVWAASLALRAQDAFKRNKNQTVPPVNSQLANPNERTRRRTRGVGGSRAVPLSRLPCEAGRCTCVRHVDKMMARKRGLGASAKVKEAPYVLGAPPGVRTGTSAGLKSKQLSKWPSDQGWMLWTDGQGPYMQERSGSTAADTDGLLQTASASVLRCVVDVLRGRGRDCGLQVSSLQVNCWIQHAALEGSGMGHCSRQRLDVALSEAKGLAGWLTWVVEPVSSNCVGIGQHRLPADGPDLVEALDPEQKSLVDEVLSAW